MLLLHIGSFKLDPEIDKVKSDRSGFHKHFDLAIHTKLACTLMAVFAIALTPNGHWWTWLIYGLALITTMWFSQVSLTKLAKHLAVESAFIGVILLGTLFRSGGEVLWSWGWLRITTEGVMVLGSVTLKALLSLLALNILTLSTSIPLLLQGLVMLRTPPLLVAILASMYRYILVLVEEFNAMHRAAISRNFDSSNLQGYGKKGDWQRQVIGNTIGVLFIRTYERGDRIHQAMLTRGYRGIPPVSETPRTGGQDILALTLTVTVGLLGQIVYLKF